MQFTTTALALAASAAVANAGIVTFWTLDDVQRTVHFTPSAGHSDIESVVVNNKENKTVTFPDQYIGNFYAIPDGKDNVPGMLGEVTFGGFGGKTFFDVSAIVSPDDHDNVKQMWPEGETGPMSGCFKFPCDNAYWLPDDVQTKVTDSTSIITTLGSGSVDIAFTN